MLWALCHGNPAFFQRLVCIFWSNYASYRSTSLFHCRVSVCLIFHKDVSPGFTSHFCDGDKSEKHQ